jgi:predicted nucleotidyltransferase
MSTDAILARRRTERTALIGLARRYAEDLPADGLRAVVVFGSVARGDHNRWSDVDVLVVVERADAAAHRRTDAWPPAPGRVQVIVWTVEEWVTQHARDNPIAVEALERGVWLVGRVDHLLSAAEGRSTP